MSQVRSPQQIVGSIVKRLVPEVLNLKSEEIYHACIMACYDKKLEATRREFEYVGIKDVDTVLTSNELLEVITKLDEGFPEGNKFIDTLQNIKLLSDYRVYQPYFSLEQLLLTKMESSNVNSAMTINKPLSYEAALYIQSLYKPTSNSYMESVLKRYIVEVLKEKPENVNIVYKQGKNSDLEECIISYKGQDVFVGARIYGLKNIQNIVRNIKKGLCKYKYIEVMACPGGCLNGGGQIKPREKEMKPKELVGMLNQILTDLNSKVVRSAEEDVVAKEILGGKGKIGVELYTTYKAVEKSVLTMSSLKW